MPIPFNLYEIPNGFAIFIIMGLSGTKRNRKCITEFLFTGRGYGSIIPQPSDADPDPLQHEPTRKLVGSIVDYVEQYVEAMEKVIEILASVLSCNRKLPDALFR